MLQTSLRGATLAGLSISVSALLVLGCGSNGRYGSDDSASSGGSEAGSGTGGSLATGGGTAASGGAASGGASSGGSTGTGTTFEEGDAALCGMLGVVETTHTGFTGTGYLNLEDKRGAGVSWVVEAATAGDVTLTIRYANGTAESRSASLRVAHQDESELEFAGNGDWASWQTEVVTVHLEAGVQHLSLIAASSAGLPNVDSLTLTGTGLAAARCDAYAPGAGRTFTTPHFDNVSVHDPSVVPVDGQYYVFGSHLAAAKTSDWMSWDLVAGEGVNANNPLFDNVITELATAFAWSEVVGLWAADVLQLKSNDRYLMYYNSCKGSEPRSALGIASSTSVEGPYEDDGIFLYSGMWGQTSPDGTIYNASVHPNAIDPDSFYDASGKPWMVYGSYSGGIFILELDPATGKPKSGQGYGKHLLGGNHAPIEGPYIQYVPESGYYYLFTSYGGLDATGGYNVRVARATAPDGPYLDSNGIDQATVKADPAVPLFDTVTIAPSGVKLIGNHSWTNSGGTQGYVSPGHNSAFHDDATGQTFLVFHTRFPGQGEFHQVRVHEMFVNVDGWLVAAPLRYAPRAGVTGVPQAQLEYVGLSEVPGSYEVVRQARAISSTIVASQTVTLAADGSVSGALSGTWTFGGDNVISVTLDGTSFRGVLSRQWNEQASAFQVTFSGMEAVGTPLWGVRTGS